MNIALNGLVLLIAIQHIGFLVLEMFLWTEPIGQKVFKTTPEFAAQSAALAANQGLYNGFLAAGLIWSLLPASRDFSSSLKYFFLSCVAIAGLYGWYTVSVTILFVQAMPAILALVVLLFSQRVKKFD